MDENTMFCPNCGAPTAPGEKFCQQCGTKLPTAAAPVPPAPEAPAFEKTEILNEAAAPAYEAPAAPAYEAPAAPAYEAPAAPAYEAPAAPAYEAPAAPVYEAPAAPAYQAPAAPAYQAPAAPAYEAPAAPAYQAPAAPAYQAPAAPAYQAPAYGTPAYPTAVPPKKKKKTGLIITLCSIAAVLIAAALVFFLVLTPSSVLISKTSASVDVGDTLTLTATVEPGSAVLFKDITWTSGNPAVATVSPTGTVTGVSAGECTIIASAGNGKSASCTLKVNENPYDAAVIGKWDCSEFLNLDDYSSFNPHDSGDYISLTVNADHTYVLDIAGSVSDGNWEYKETDSDGDYKYTVSASDSSFYYIVEDGEIWYFVGDYCLTFVK